MLIALNGMECGQQCAQKLPSGTSLIYMPILMLTICFEGPTYRLWQRRGGAKDGEVEKGSPKFHSSPCSGHVVLREPAPCRMEHAVKESNALECTHSNSFAYHQCWILQSVHSNILAQWLEKPSFLSNSTVEVESFFHCHHYSPYVLWSP